MINFINIKYILLFLGILTARIEAIDDKEYIKMQLDINHMPLMNDHSKNAIRAAQEMMRLIKSFGYEARVIGGFVRNLVIGENDLKDIDMATTMRPLLLSQKLKALGIQNRRGDGWVIVPFRGYIFDIKVTRKAVRVQNNKMTIELTKSWYEDSLTADFSMNSLYMDEDLNIYDYHNGIQDIHDRKIVVVDKVCLAKRSSILIRYYRFLLKYKCAHDDSTVSILRRVSGFLPPSANRALYSELLEFFKYDDAFYLCDSCMWVFDILFEMKQHPFINHKKFEIFKQMSPEDRVATLLIFNGEDIFYKLSKRLRIRKRREWINTLLALKGNPLSAEQLNQDNCDMNRLKRLFEFFDLETNQLPT